MEEDEVTVDGRREVDELHNQSLQMNPGYGSGGYSDFTTVNSPANISHMIEAEAMNSTLQAGIMNPPEMFNLEAGMELLAFPNSKNNMRDSSSTLRSSSDVFKGFLALNQQQQSNQEEGPSSTSAASTTVAAANYHHHPFLSHHHQQEFSGRFQEELLTNQGSGSLLLSSGQDYPQQLHRPSRHGLSLSLSPHNPSEIRIQHFESTVSDDIRYGVPYRTNYGGNTFRPYDLKHSKYLLATQELLYEFCNLGTRRQLNGNQPKKQPFIQDSATTINPSLYTVDFLELQKRKCKLVAMREEVDRRYKIYCEQMRAVVASFEVVAGEGAADVYSSLASRAMSKHFRCLRDGILDQVKAIKKVLGEKDSIGPGTTKGETPRLRLLDQSLRQQKAYQSMGMMENHPWRPQRGLPERSVSILRSWLFEHFLHPYPSDVDKHVLARQTGLSRSQVSNWFINARVRLWKPMIEDMYVEEAKDQDKESIGGDNERSFHSSSSFLQSQHQISGEMPPLTSLHDSDSLSSIINGEDAKRKSTNIASAATITTMKDQQPFGGLNYEFSSYPNGNSSSSSHQKQYPNNGSVSLTLGLHQHSAANPPSAYHPSLFFPRDNNTQLDECHPLQFSSLEDAQGVPEGNSGFGTQYRSGHLVGTQLLHDFVG